jgi:hypothetical protein
MGDNRAGNFRTDDMTAPALWGFSAGLVSILEQHRGKQYK